MKRILTFFIMLFACCNARAFAGTLPSDFTRANDLYARGQYAAAAEAYESLRQQSQMNAALYYNLGNAYYRNGQPGKALLNYQRAARLTPRDADVRANIAFLRQVIKEPAPSFAAAVREYCNSLLSVNELTALCSLFFILCCAGAIARSFRKNSWLLLSVVAMLLLCIISGGWLLLKLDAEVWTRHAVVTSGSVDVRNGPGAENSVGFTLPEGRTVAVLGENNDWAAVGLPAEGLRGWVEKKNIEPL